MPAPPHGKLHACNLLPYLDNPLVPCYYLDMSKERSDWADALAGTNVKVIDQACAALPATVVWAV